MPKHIQLRQLTAEERRTLEEMSRSRKMEQRLVERAPMILLKAAGQSTAAVAAAVGRSQETVVQWVKRFNERGVVGLNDAAGRGRPLRYSEEMRGELIGVARTHPQALGLPFGAWTLDRLTDYVNTTLGIGISRAQLGRVLEAEGLRWYQEQTYFTERPDPQFAQKRGR